VTISKKMIALARLYPTAGPRLRINAIMTASLS
jgi:hypothetical protein